MQRGFTTTWIILCEVVSLYNTPSRGTFAVGLEMTTPLKVGLFGIGLAAYWSQFPRLRERLSGFLEQVARQIARPGVEILNLGLK